MKKIIYIIAVSLLGLTSCDESFEEINTNKNLPTEGTPNNLLTGILFNTADIHNSFNSSVINPMMQYQSNIDGGGQYDFRNGIWGDVYAAFTNISDIENQAALDPSLTGYAVVCKIIRGYYGAVLTETYIDVPFSESGKGFLDNIQPTYDEQEAILIQIIADLKEANTMINSQNLALGQGGDLIFDGDMSKWQKLANSLRLRYLLKMSKVTSGIDVAAEMQQIVSNPSRYPIFESNEDDAILDYTGNFPFIGAFDGLTSSQFEIRAASKFYVDLLSPSNDPRLDYFYALPSNPNTNVHKGVPAGLSNSDFRDQFPNGASDISLLNPLFFDVKGQIDYALMTYTELNFILAEAVLKGFIAGNAETFYNEGIASSFDFWELTMPSNFLTQTNVVWDGTLETLMSQKWVAANLVFDFELWSDYKRTGLPDFNLPALTFPSTNGEIPTRMIYPITEQSLNTINYNAAVQNIGGDNSLSKHWYQGN